MIVLTETEQRSLERLRRLYAGESYDSVYSTQRTGGGMQELDVDRVLEALFREIPPRIARQKEEP